MKLNLGCGDKLLPGWVNVDLQRADVCHDLSQFPWPFEDESADEILASHVLEHFDRKTGEFFLRECWRVLKARGVLRLAVPDMDIFSDCMNSGDWSPINGYTWREMNHFLGGDDGQEPNVAQRHRYMYCWASLAYTLMGWGFAPRRVEQRPLDNPDYAAISLYVDAVK